MNRYLLLGTLFLLAACVPKKVEEQPIMENNQRAGDASATVAAASDQAERNRASASAERGAIQAEALADCAPEVCDAVVRGELALGMNEVQVLAATRTTEDAWSIRNSGPSLVMVPEDERVVPSDVVGNVAMVQLADNRVSRYGYSEAQGIRLVDDPYDATTEGRAEALAESLIREGDGLAAQGDLDAALDRYDRASVLAPADPMIDYKIAAVLDKALRPYEAMIQYQLFLHRLNLETIEAEGAAAAQLAEAIALAQQRLVILERQAR
jgi:tetratricopeptide (TPR) repeat protein